ncbi:MAG TPA: hypothetical protein VHL14_07690 [Steroidobacteraceae bacterium]|jgi:hypothetical protein|nr:hypothetical protein [Steroidobacteraceae bacterium]
MRSALLFALIALASIVNFPVHAEPAIQIFECTVNGQRVFSDHSCGDDSVQRNVLVANTMEATKVTSEKSVTSKKPRTNRPAASTDERDKRRQHCARIQKSRDAINDKMRAGYTAKQDERLHDRLRKLNDDYFELRCSSVR